MKFEIVDFIVTKALTAGMVLSAFMYTASVFAEVGCNKLAESNFQNATCKFPGVIVR